MPRAGQRQRRGTGPERRGIHELEDPSDWPAEPAVETGPLDAARFDAAVEKVCGEVAPNAGLPAVAEVVRQVSAETGADPFLIAALAYRTSRCRPSSTGAGGDWPARDSAVDVRAGRAAAVSARRPRSRGAARSGAQPAGRDRALQDVGGGARRDRSRARQHAASDGAGALLLGRSRLGDDRRGSHADGAPPAARGVREPAADVPRLVAGTDDRGAARRRDAARDQRPRRRSGRRRAVASRARHRRDDRRAGARGRRRRRAVRRRRPDRRSPGARPLSAAGAPLAQPHHGAGRVLRAHHARGRGSAAATSTSPVSASSPARPCTPARSSAPSGARA